MLDQCYENVDYVSLHRYYSNAKNDLQDFLAKNLDMDAFIKTVASLCDAIGGKKHSRKKLNLSFDEWNVWYHSNEQDKQVVAQNRWGNSLPLLEDIYNFEDALLVGGMLITLLRNSDRVKIACLAQLVNVIAPIMTTDRGCWSQTIYWPFMHASQYGRGTALRPVIKAPSYSSTNYDDVPLIDAVAVLGDNGSLTIFVLNRALNNDIELSCDLRAFGNFRFCEHIVLHHDDVKATNSEDEPNKVIPVVRKEHEAGNGKISIRLQALSWNVLKFDTQTL
jgi:alpha-N-arabinofuranosidase